MESCVKKYATVRTNRDMFDFCALQIAELYVVGHSLKTTRLFTCPIRLHMHSAILFHTEPHAIAAGLTPHGHV